MATSTSRRRRPGPDTTYHLFGGKGGVGKTTCAAAHALALAARGARTLVVSTDPAPSLGDVLKARLTSQPRRIRAGRAILFATEIDAARAMRWWLRERRATLAAIALRGTWLDEGDIAALLSLTLPGIDEIAALLELLRFGESGRYDAIVIDAAPTGHSLRMLALPDTMAGVAQVFDHMQEKHRVMVEALRGAWRPDDADMLIRELQDDARGLAELLRIGRPNPRVMGDIGRGAFGRGNAGRSRMAVPRTHSGRAPHRERDHAGAFGAVPLVSRSEATSVERDVVPGLAVSPRRAGCPGPVFRPGARARHGTGRFAGPPVVRA